MCVCDFWVAVGGRASMVARFPRCLLRFQVAATSLWYTAPCLAFGFALSAYIQGSTFAGVVLWVALGGPSPSHKTRVECFMVRFRAGRNLVRNHGWRAASN